MSAGESPAHRLDKSIPSNGISECTGPEEEEFLACSKNNKKAGVNRVGEKSHWR